MSRIPNPFSLYDLLGYFFPGALFVYGAALSVGHIHPELTATAVYRKVLDFGDLGLVLPFVLLSYVAGHLVSYLSSITVERYATLQYDQPSRFLLNIRIQKPYFFGQLAEGGFEFWRVLLGLFMLPVAVFDLILGQLPGLSRVYARGLDKLLAPALRRRAYERLVAIIGFDPKKEEHGKPAETDFFLFLQHFALGNCERHGPKIDNYLALYGFLRSITLHDFVELDGRVPRVQHRKPNTPSLWDAPNRQRRVVSIFYGLHEVLATLFTRSPDGCSCLPVTGHSD